MCVLRRKVPGCRGSGEVRLREQTRREGFPHPTVGPCLRWGSKKTFTPYGRESPVVPKEWESRPDPFYT